MSNIWVYEPTTGRYYFQWRSDSGKTLRHYCAGYSQQPPDTSIEEVSELTQSAVISEDLGNLPDAAIYPKVETLDSRFAAIAKPSRFFNVGRVFKALWTEPAGGTISNIDRRFYSDVSYGELSFTKMRRFVVIRKRLHSCLCLAIYTYGGQGATKDHVRPQDHAMIFARGCPEPIAFPEEQPTKGAFPVIVEEPNETIDPMSLLDFSRVYTVEHNIKVLKIGRIPPEHIERLEKYFVQSIALPKDTVISDLQSPDLTKNSAKLDSSFRTRKSEFYTVGRVFSALWTCDDSDVSSSEICSFVVVRRSTQVCTCHRLRTFHNWGPRKPDIILTEAVLEDYSLVYSSRPPKPVNGITKMPLRVELSSALSAGEIREPTLLHYGKFYQIGCNIKTKKIGSLDTKSMELFVKYSQEYIVLDLTNIGTDIFDFRTSVIEAMDLSSTLLQYICDVRDCSDDCATIRDETATTMGFLYALSTQLKNAEETGAGRGLFSAYQQAFAPGGPIEQFKGGIQHLIAKLVPTGTFHKPGTALHWTVEEEDVAAVLNTVRRQKISLGLTLQNDTETNAYVLVD